MTSDMLVIFCSIFFHDIMVFSESGAIGEGQRTQLTLSIDVHMLTLRGYMYRYFQVKFP